MNLSSDSWLLKGGLLLFLLFGIALFVRFVAFSLYTCISLVQTPCKVSNAIFFSESSFT